MAQCSAVQCIFVRWGVVCGGCGAFVRSFFFVLSFVEINLMGVVSNKNFISCYVMLSVILCGVMGNVILLIVI